MRTAFVKDDNTIVKARWNPVRRGSYVQRNGHVKRFCRVRARDLRKKANAEKHFCINTETVIECIPNTFSCNKGRANHP